MSRYAADRLLIDESQHDAADLRLVNDARPDRLQRDRPFHASRGGHRLFFIGSGHRHRRSDAKRLDDTMYVFRREPPTA